MGKAPTGIRDIAIRLVHDGVQPGTKLNEPLHFGLQDIKALVHPGSPAPDDTLCFDLTVSLKNDTEATPPAFSGPFVHGPASGRFLYLSWKREGDLPAPWGWRIKIPLSGIGWSDIRAAEAPGKCLTAIVIGRRPHVTAPIEWRVEPLLRSKRP